jgi:hypothetical protein
MIMRRHTVLAFEDDTDLIKCVFQPASRLLKGRYNTEDSNIIHREDR